MTSIRWGIIRVERMGAKTTPRTAEAELGEGVADQRRKNSTESVVARRPSGRGGEPARGRRSGQRPPSRFERPDLECEASSDRLDLLFGGLKGGRHVDERRIMTMPPRKRQQRSRATIVRARSAAPRRPARRPRPSAARCSRGQSIRMRTARRSLRRGHSPSRSGPTKAVW